MAEIISSKNKGGVLRIKKLSPRIDLTPMVDLGFLLITFFIFTTVSAQPNSVNLNLPDETPVINGTKTLDKKTISFILGANNKVFFYYGILNGSFRVTDYNAAGIRVILNKFMHDVQQTFGSRYEATVLIKPTADALYKNVIDILDEMIIPGVTKYVVMDLTDDEHKLLNLK